MTAGAPSKADTVTQRALDAIRRGDLTEAQVGSLFNACCERMVAGAVGVRWEVDIPAYGVRFGEDDITLNDAREIKRRAGVTTGQLDLLGDADHFFAVVIAYCVGHLGWDPDDAESRIGQIPVNEAADLVRTVAVKDDPKGRLARESVAGT
jgi:thiamine monophosphate synthase